MGLFGLFKDKGIYYNLTREEMDEMIANGVADSPLYQGTVDGKTIYKEEYPMKKLLALLMTLAMLVSAAGLASADVDAAAVADQSFHIHGVP